MVSFNYDWFKLMVNEDNTNCFTDMIHSSAVKLYFNWNLLFYYRMFEYVRLSGCKVELLWNITFGTRSCAISQH